MNRKKVDDIFMQVVKRLLCRKLVRIFKFNFVVFIMTVLYVMCSKGQGRVFRLFFFCVAVWFEDNLLSKFRSDGRIVYESSERAREY